MKDSELLAPVGTLSALVPMIEAGADAVYVGLSGLSSRPQSADFTIQEIRYAAAICHDHHVKLHVAVNCCIRETMLEQTKALLQELDNIGIDAVILADWGLIAYAVRQMKHTEVHASTLLGTYNTPTVRYLQQIGVKRLVFSTNLYIDEIASMIASLPEMQYEFVADGGICFNDNRICELPHLHDGENYRVYCRQPYILTMDGQIQKALPIHAESISSAEIAAMYLELGLYSFKVEGRTADYHKVVRRVQKLRKMLDEASEHLTNKNSVLHYISRMRKRQ